MALDRIKRLISNAFQQARIGAPAAREMGERGAHETRRAAGKSAAAYPCRMKEPAFLIQKRVPSMNLFRRIVFLGSGEAFDGRAHFVPLFFHIRDKLELRAATVQIVLGIMDTEIRVAGQVIGQETHAAFQRHQLGAHGQRGFFVRGQALPAGA